MIGTLAPSQQFKKETRLRTSVFLLSIFFNIKILEKLNKILAKINQTCTTIFLSPNFFIKILAKFCQKKIKILIRTTQHPAHSILFYFHHKKPEG
jgi:hypothetical protein